MSFLPLDAVEVVQQSHLPGASPAVAGVEQARRMVMLDQHGYSSALELVASMWVER
jgi:hypothetical protein